MDDWMVDERMETIINVSLLPGILLFPGCDSGLQNERKEIAKHFY
jgi:hypothetical protein